MTARLTAIVPDRGDAHDIVVTVHELYAQCPPQDRADAIIVMHPLLRDSLKRLVDTMRGRVPPAPPPTAMERAALIVDPPPIERVFGLRIETSDQLEPRRVELWAENDRDRAFRRAREAGQTINVVHMDAYPVPVPPPTPTLRALLRHWAKRWTKRGAR